MKIEEIKKFLKFKVCLSDVVISIRCLHLIHIYKALVIPHIFNATNLYMYSKDEIKYVLKFFF